MPKMKTFRGARKRFRFTATGKLRRHQACKRHILTKKNRGRKRALAKDAPVALGDAKRIRRMLPYGV